MKFVKYAVAGLVVLALGIGIGAAGQDPDSVVAEATPTLSPEPTADPTPTPTPRVVYETVTETVEVEVTPQSCIDALNWMVTDGAKTWGLIASLYDDYLDFPDENLAEFGARVETRLNDFDPGEPFEAVEPDIDACMGF